MRRKVFAVLMIVALILCFMPSTAFAWYGGNVEIPPADFGGESGGECLWEEFVEAYAWDYYTAWYYLYS